MSERRSAEEPRPIEITDPVTIHVDGRDVVVQNGELVIDACQRNDTYIPRFCYHPRMKPVGMCRMCLVEIDSGRGPSLQPSCMITVTPDMTVTTDSPLVSKVQDGVLEYLLINHPLDCPVCDKGGECPLQDQTMSYGPGESRFVEEKRHYEKPIPISQHVLLDRERCILCDRCTRFAAEVTDDPLIHFIDRGANTQVNTFPGEPFNSYFSGNTVQICPVGALTAKPYRFKARPWDLQQTESTCVTCSVGCRLNIDSSRDQVLRYNGIDSDPVNWSWLCDKGRFGFEAVASPDRLTTPLTRDRSGALVAATWSDALGAVADAIRATLAGRGPSGVAVLGGANLTNEAAYAWARLAKGVIGTDHVDAQLGDGLPAEVFDLPGATIDDVCDTGGTVLYLGPDPKEELPVLFLRLKHAMLNDGVKVVQVTPTATSLSPYATVSLHPRPGETASVVRALLAGAGATAADVGGVAAADLTRAAAVLGDADEGLRVVVGRANLAESPAVVLDAAAAVLDARPAARFLPAVRRANVRGAVLAGLTPGRLPGGVALDAGRDTWAQVWTTVPATSGLDADGILAATAEGRIDVLVLLGSDPAVDFRDGSLARRALAAVPTVVVLDRFLSASTEGAHVVLPVAGFAECDGTTTNMEGRVTVLNARVNAPGTARPDWTIAADLAELLGDVDGADLGPAELWAELIANAPALSQITPEALAAEANVDGILVDLDAQAFTPPATPSVPSPNAYSSRLVVNRVLYDGGESLSHCPSSVPLVREGAVVLGTADAAALAVEAGTRLTVSSKNGTLSGPLVVDGRVPKGTVAIHHALSVDASALISADDVVCDVRVEVG